MLPLRLRLDREEPLPFFTWLVAMFEHDALMLVGDTSLGCCRSVECEGLVCTGGGGVVLVKDN